MSDRTVQAVRPAWPLRRLAGACLLALALAGCAAKRSGYDVPAVPLPDQYKNAASAETNQQLAAAQAETPPLPDSVPDKGLVEWWRFFGSPELEQLIDRGIANNPDVRIATLRVAQAKARADQARAGQLPEISAPLLVGRQFPGGGTVGDVPTSSNTRQPQTAYQASLRGSWRLDVWGEQSALAESANLQLWRAVFERDNTQRNLAASLASNYVEYASLNDRLQVARELETVLAATLPTIEKRVEVGDATLTELEQQRAAIFALRAMIPTLEQQREDVLNTIAFMVGTVPGGVKLSEAGLDTLGLPAVVPGLPSVLLLRRPDVRMAEARLLSADADIDVARARILPPVDLSAQVGYSSMFLNQLFQPQALFWNAIASVTASIFDGGKRSSEKEYAQAVHEEMVETYIRTIYQAMREVEGSLATIRLASRRLDAQEEATLAAKRAWEISSKVYGMGGVDYMTLLDTERTYYRYLDEYQRTRMDHLRGYVTLFQALGGGVKVGEVLPGRGDRPLRAFRQDGKVRQGLPPKSPVRAFSADGVEWAAGRTIADEEALQVEEFYQVELVGLYHRAAIGAAWRDLRARYPAYMENRVLRPRLSGRVEDSVDGQEAWYRLYVAKFSSIAAAEEFCGLLMKGQQRCRVVTSRSNEPVASATQEVKGAASAVAGKPLSVTEAAPSPISPEVLVEAPVDSAPASFAEAPTLAEPAPLKAKLRTGKGGRSPVAVPAPPRLAAERLAYTVQLGAFSNLDNAAIAHAVWQFRGYDVYVSENRDPDGRVWYAVRSGVFPQRRDGARVAQSIREAEDAAAVVVPTVLGKNGKPSEVGGDRLLPAANGNSAQFVQIVPEPPEAAPTVREPLQKNTETKRPEAKPATHYSVQLGAFANADNAGVARDFWKGRGYDVFVETIADAKGRTWYAVRSGVFAVRREAATLALAMGRKEHASATVVATRADVPAKPAALSPESGNDRNAAAILDGRDEAPTAAIDPTPAIVAPAADKAAATRPTPIYSVQLDAFSSIENAVKSVLNWRDRGYDTYVCEFRNAGGRDLYAVRTGEFAHRRDASRLVRTLGRKEGARAALVQAALDGAGNLVKIDLRQHVGADNLLSNGR